MKVKEIPFIGRRRPAALKEIFNLSNLGWNGTSELPMPIRFNDVICTHFVISEYGAIRLTQASNKDGKYSYWNTDKKLPVDISETAQGWMIVPWGELMRTTGCGVGIYLYEQDGNVIFDYEVKSQSNSRLKYTFRVEFPLREPNLVRCFYHHCVSGYTTYIGIAKEPDNVISWPLEENYPYMLKALEFDTSAEEEIPEEIKPFPPQNPMGPQPQPEPPVQPEPQVWVTKFINDTVRVQTVSVDAI